ncbi:MAG: hypothetical protein QUS11_06635 [Candidatus Fermentibacter sp.]|nr:hypothetical protein [Candidatus Fermentibacter sp.]
MQNVNKSSSQKDPGTEASLDRLPRRADFRDLPRMRRGDALRAAIEAWGLRRAARILEGGTDPFLPHHPPHEVLLGYFPGAAGRGWTARAGSVAAAARARGVSRQAVYRERTA